LLYQARQERELKLVDQAALKAEPGVLLMGRRKIENDLTRSVAKMLLESRDRAIIEARRQKIERLKLTEWRIWKLLGISWR